MRRRLRSIRIGQRQILETLIQIVEPSRLFSTISIPVIAAAMRTWPSRWPWRQTLFAFVAVVLTVVVLGTLLLLLLLLGIIVVLAFTFTFGTRHITNFHRYYAIIVLVIST